jgi:hypothetical protein
MPPPHAVARGLYVSLGKVAIRHPVLTIPLANGE